MSDTPTTEIFNTAVADQLKNLAGDGSPKFNGTSTAHEKKPSKKRIPPAQTPDRAALTGTLLKSKTPLPSIERSAERTKAIGAMLDEGREWMSNCALEIVSLWKESNESDEGSTTRVLLEEDAGNLIQKVAEFIGLRHADSSLSDDEKKRLARSFAIYYASVIWGAKYVPDAEIWRALWFLLQTDAARVAHESPQGAESVRVLPKMWIEFPHAFLGAPTSDGRALEESGLLDVSGAAGNLIEKDSRGYWKCIGDIKKQATINSIAEFLKTPRAGIFALPVYSVYRADSGQFYGGGMLAVKSEGSEDAGFHLSIIQVVDDCVLASYERAVRTKAPLQAKFPPLSLGFNAVLRGERLPSLKLPFEGFKTENLNERQAELGRYEDDGDRFNALCHIARILKRALRMAIHLPAPRASARQADVKRSGKEPRRETAEKREPREATRSKTAPEAISSEENSQAEKALKQASDEKNLAVIPQADFFSPAQPAGCAHAVLKRPVRGSSGIHCVVMRSIARAKVEIYWYPKRLEHLFAEGKHTGLVYSFFIKQTKFDYFKSRAPVLPQKTGEAGPVSAAPDAETTVAEEGKKQEDAPPPEVSHTEPKEQPPVANNIWASPQARALAEKLGIADEVIPASRGGKVTKTDVEAYHSKTVKG